MSLSHSDRDQITSIHSSLSFFEEDVADPNRLQRLRDEFSGRGRKVPIDDAELGSPSLADEGANLISPYK